MHIAAAEEGVLVVKYTANGVDGPQIQWITAVAKAKFVSIENVLILLPAVGEVIVQVLVHDMLIVTNAGATMGVVSKSATKLTRGTAVHVLKDTDPVGSHVSKFVAIQVIGRLRLMALKHLTQPVVMDET